MSSYTGYKQAYIIRNDRTVLGDGGGICQVSTTLFRTALNAGLPIVERRVHLYHVSYYEQNSEPDFDATVYVSITDLKIKNTPSYILIQTINDPVKKTLDFEIYGTDDRRIVTITKPLISSETPPPEDLDPTKPEGTIEQIYWKTWDAEASFNYIVEKNNEIIFQKTFYSNYRPWQSIFLQRTAPI